MGPSRSFFWLGFVIMASTPLLSSSLSSSSSTSISPLSVSGAGDGVTSITPRPGDLSPHGLVVNLQSYDSFGGATERMQAGPCLQLSDGAALHSPLLHNMVSMASGSSLSGEQSFFMVPPSEPSSESASASSTATSNSSSSTTTDLRESETEEESSIVGDESEVIEIRRGMSVLKRECYVLRRDESGRSCYECKVCGEKMEGKKKHLLDFFKHYEKRHREKFVGLDKSFFEKISREAARFCFKALKEVGSEEVLKVLEDLCQFGKASGTPKKKKEKKVKEKGEVAGKEKRKEIRDGKEEVDFSKEESEERVKVFRQVIGSGLVKGIVDVGKMKMKMMEEGEEDIGTTIDGAVQITLSDGDFEEEILDTLK